MPVVYTYSTGILHGVFDELGKTAGVGVVIVKLSLEAPDWKPDLYDKNRSYNECGASRVSSRFSTMAVL